MNHTANKSAPVLTAITWIFLKARIIPEVPAPAVLVAKRRLMVLPRGLVACSFL